MNCFLNKWLYNYPSGNYLLFGNGYVVSYNPSTKYTFEQERIKNPKFRFPLDEDSKETALYIKESKTYLILNGDFREEYEECNSLKDCMAVYKQHVRIFGSQYSSGLPH